jgi:hypothetical protein
MQHTSIGITFRVYYSTAVKMLQNRSGGEALKLRVHSSQSEKGIGLKFNSGPTAVSISMVRLEPLHLPRQRRKFVGWFRGLFTTWPPGLSVPARERRVTRSTHS